MPLPHKILNVGKPGISEGSKTYIRPMVVVQSTITPKEFIDKFAKTVRLSKADIVRFTHALKAFLLEELKNGNIVQTGVLGTFSPILTNPKNNASANIKTYSPKPGIYYRPSGEMNKEIKMWEMKKQK